MVVYIHSRLWRMNIGIVSYSALFLRGINVHSFSWIEPSRQNKFRLFEHAHEIVLYKRFKSAKMITARILCIPCSMKIMKFQTREKYPLYGIRQTDVLSNLKGITSTIFNTSALWFFNYNGLHHWLEIHSKT